MKIWKIITVLLAVLLLAGCVGCVSADVTSIVITNIDTPETGETPDTSASTSTSKVTLEKPTWSPTVSSTFDAGTTYTVSVVAKTTDKFSPSVSATVNGKTATSVTLSNSNKTATVTYKFPATDSADLMSKIEVTGLTAPVTAATPDKTASVTTDEGSSSATITEISWSPSDSYFLLDKAYTVKIKIKPSSKEYAWDSSLTATIGGKTLTSSQITKSDDVVTLTYTYPKTTVLGTISSMNLQVSAPVVGNSPSATVTSKTTGISGTAVWSPSGKFQPDTSYTTTITVKTNYGYLLGSTVSATVNGATAYAIKYSDTEATVSYTFAQIASVDSVDVRIAAPATGDTAAVKPDRVTSKPESSANAATIQWSPALVDGAFEAGTEYTATVTIPIISSSNSVFDKETIVYINGEKAEVVSVSSNSITATYTFPKTTFIPNPIEIIKEFYNLMLAIFNPASYFF